MKYIFILLFSLSANILLSQLNWGFRVGSSISTFKNGVFYSNIIRTRGVDPEPTSQISPIVGIDLSTFIKYQITPSVSVQTELHFLNKGGEILHHNISDLRWINGMSTLYKLDVIEVPIIFKLHLGKKKSIVPFLGWSFGYRVGRRLSGNVFCKYNEVESFSTCRKPQGTRTGWLEFQNPDVSALLGFCYEEKVMGQKIIIDLRYLYDFTDDFSNLGIEGATLRHRNLLISIGVEF